MESGLVSSLQALHASSLCVCVCVCVCVVFSFLCYRLLEHSQILWDLQCSELAEKGLWFLARVNKMFMYLGRNKLFLFIIFFFLGCDLECWSLIPACSKPYVLFNRGDTKGTNSSNILCLMFVYVFFFFFNVNSCLGWLCCLWIICGLMTCVQS